MRKFGSIVQYTSDELAEMIRRGEDETDVARLDAMTEEELEASIDFAEEGEPIWSEAIVGLPEPSPSVKVGIDVDIVRWFEAQGQDYRGRINAVLRGHVEAHAREAATPSRS